MRLDKKILSELERYRSINKYIVEQAGEEEQEHEAMIRPGQHSATQRRGHRDHHQAQPEAKGHTLTGKPPLSQHQLQWKIHKLQKRLHNVFGLAKIFISWRLND